MSKCENPTCRPVWGLLILVVWAVSCAQIETDGKAESRVASSASAITNETVQAGLCEFSVFGSQATDIRDRTATLNGKVGSNSYVELGSNTRVTGDVISGGDVKLKGSYVDGNLTAAGSVTRQEGTVVTGFVHENETVPAIQIPTKEFDPGNQNVAVYSGQSFSLSPGRYGTVTVYGNAALQLHSGSYQLNKLIVESSRADISMDVGSGPIVVDVNQTFRIGNQTNMTLSNGTDPKLVQFYLASAEQAVVGTDMTFVGELTAPNSEIMVYSRVVLHGSVHARRVVMDTDGQITGAGCGEVDTEYPRGADTMTRTIGTWWPDYRRGQVSTVDGIRLSIENMVSTGYVVSASLKFLGPLGAVYTKGFSDRALSPGSSTTYFVSSADLPMRSETSAMQVQPEFIIKRETADDEIRTVPPIYFQHLAGSDFSRIDLFDENTLLTQLGGKTAWGPSENEVSPGDLLGYVGDSETRRPIVAGTDVKAKIYNELGEVIGYKLGAKLEQGE